MELKINQKYAQIFNSALNKSMEESSGNDDVCSISSDGIVTPAEPIGYDNEQLEFNAVADTLLKAFVEDKDYVSWSNGGYPRQEHSNVLETFEGRTLQKFDPVQILDNLGFPLGQAVFIDAETIEENDQTFICPIFKRIFDDDIHLYKPKCRI